MIDEQCLIIFGTSHEFLDSDSGIFSQYFFMLWQNKTCDLVMTFVFSEQCEHNLHDYIGQSFFIHKHLFANALEILNDREH